MSTHTVFDLFVSLAPLLPIVLHLFKLEKTELGAIVVRLLPDVVGAVKKASEADKP